MNRRNFFGTLLAASAGFAILPGAGRIWKAVKSCWIMPLSSGGVARWKTTQEILNEWEIPNPDYNKAALEMYFMCPKEEWNAWTKLMKTKTWPAGMGGTFDESLYE